MQAIDYLINRNSMKLVTSPGPTPEELDKIMQAAMSAPDHGALRPWRFKIIQGDAVKTFGNLSIQLCKNSKEKPMTEEKAQSLEAWFSTIPLIIAVACHIDYSNTKIREEERVLATGAAVMNILNAAHMLGYGAFWSTGGATYLDEFQSALGFDALDYRFLGFLVIGTPRMPIPAKERPSYTQFTQPWTAPLV